jgi:hypothetical protein
VLKLFLVSGSSSLRLSQLSLIQTVCRKCPECVQSLLSELVSCIRITRAFLQGDQKNMITYEVTEFFQFTTSFQLHFGPGVDSASDKNDHQMFLGSRTRPAREADNLTAMCELIVCTLLCVFIIPETCRPPLPVMWIALPPPLFFVSSLDRISGLYSEVGFY